MMLYFGLGLLFSLIYVFFMVRHIDYLFNLMDHGYFAALFFGVLFLLFLWPPIVPLILVVLLGIKFRKKSH